MRPYRGLTKDGKWVYGWYLVVGQMHLIIPLDAKISFCAEYGENSCFGEISSTGNSWPCEVLPETVCQQIGLRDKKRTKEFPEGQEIYRGDIVKYREELGIIKWEKLLWIINSREDRKFYGFYGADDALFGWEELEIIGNIHENPELLEREEDHANQTE